MAQDDDLLYLFYRPVKPVFTPKGLHQNVFFQIPESIFPRRFAAMYDDYLEQSRGISVIKLVECKNIPINVDWDELKKIDPREHFMIHDPFHVKCASDLIRIFSDCRKDHLSDVFAKLSLSSVNPYLLIYAFSVALINRPDTEHIALPSPFTFSPEYFIEQKAVKEAFLEGSVIRCESKRNYIRVKSKPTSIFSRDKEDQIAYFREDFGVNVFYWNWHVTYPYFADGEFTDKILKKDRRGELFYYIHQQIVARYNVERFCNKLLRVFPLSSFTEDIPQDYYPKLDNVHTKTLWASRNKFDRLKDVTRGEHKIKIQDLETWRRNITDMIKSGSYTWGMSGTHILDPEEGIDWLGNAVQSSALSMDKEYFGNLCNMAHLLMSLLHDPEGPSHESVGVLADNRTAMRDPLFYRWYAFIDDLFQIHKKMLPPYTVDQLKLDGVEIQDFSVITQPNKHLPIGLDVKNKLYTYYQFDLVNLAYGLDIEKPGSIFVEFPHLQHQEFDYSIKIKNTGEKRNVTVRIFLGPGENEFGVHRNKKNCIFPFVHHRRYFIELDKFVETLDENSVTTIKRSSLDSSVTIPFRQLFADIDDLINELKTNEDLQIAKDLMEEVMEKHTIDQMPQDLFKKFGKEGEEKQETLQKLKASIEEAGKDLSPFAHFGCGWPHYMLIPKGKPDGFAAFLFVMVTDYEEDKTDDYVPIEIFGPKIYKSSCIKPVAAHSYGGLKNKKYPDRKHMGFPFDRFPREGVEDLEDFCQYKKSELSLEFTRIPNMKFINVSIIHYNVTLEGETVKAVNMRNQLLKDVPQSKKETKETGSDPKAGPSTAPKPGPSTALKRGPPIAPKPSQLKALISGISKVLKSEQSEASKPGPSTAPKSEPSVATKCEPFEIPIASKSESSTDPEPEPRLESEPPGDPKSEPPRDPKSPTSPGTKSESSTSHPETRPQSLKQRKSSSSSPQHLKQRKSSSGSSR